MKKLALLSLITSFFLGNMLFAQTAPQKTRILVGSPIRQKPPILHQFLESLKQLHQESCTLDYFFIDDNDAEESHKMLQSFAKEKDSHCKLFHAEDNEVKESFVCNEVTHFWREALVWKVASFKDRIIEYAQQENYDYLFLIDSDIVLHPGAIEQLLRGKKDIISNIFWTRWEPLAPLLPQVWLLDHYTLFNHEIGEKLSDVEKTKRQNAFLKKLQTAGVYEVGGLCACTLISKAALQKGVKFQRIKNITYWGEDRHFCIRALALGLSLHVDTHYPAYHIYRDSDLAGVDEFYSNIEQTR